MCNLSLLDSKVSKVLCAKVIAMAVAIRGNHLGTFFTGKWVWTNNLKRRDRTEHDTYVGTFPWHLSNFGKSRIFEDSKLLPHGDPLGLYRYRSTQICS